LNDANPIGEGRFRLFVNCLKAWEKPHVAVIL
jgi:hypothetical protein